MLESPVTASKPATEAATDRRCTPGRQALHMGSPMPSSSQHAAQTPEASPVLNSGYDGEPCSSLLVQHTSPAVLPTRSTAQERHTQHAHAHASSTGCAAAEAAAVDAAGRCPACTDVARSQSRSMLSEAGMAAACGHHPQSAVACTHSGAAAAIDAVEAVTSSSSQDKVQTTGAAVMTMRGLAAAGRACRAQEPAVCITAIQCRPVQPPGKSLHVVRLHAY